jgi:Protein of unknown function (DUF5672)
MQQVAITIPIYKETPNADELASLNQCLKILNNHPVIFFAPESLNTKVYEEVLKNKFTVERFDNQYFTDLTAYNRLMLNRKFYKKFKRFKYILIYQLDAWVFKDDLQYWCSAGYDYIGAPWFDNWNVINPGTEFCGVGNGGFSLRKVKSHIKALQTFSYIQQPADIFSSFLKGRRSLSAFKQLLLALTIRNNTFYKFNKYQENEDRFWGIVVKNNFSWFKVPDMLTAAKFSLEINAVMLYNMLNKQVPFGCHALEKYDPDFLDQLIAQSNTEIHI